MQVHDTPQAVLLAQRQRGVQLLQSRLQPAVIGCKVQRIGELLPADELPADEVGVPLLTEHTESFGVDVGTDHFARGAATGRAPL